MDYLSFLLVLFLKSVPIGISVARHIAGHNSMQLYEAAVSTLAFAAIRLFDDLVVEKVTTMDYQDGLNFS